MTSLKSSLYRYLLLCLCLLPLHLTAREGYMPVRNFTMSDYGGSAQNWSAVEDSRHRVYVANGSGVLCYDGGTWSLHQLSNYTAVRSLLYDAATGRIYAGGTDEFGYFAPQGADGQLHYTSLSQSLKGLQPALTEVWNIVRSGSNIWFRSDYHLFCYDGRKVTTTTSTKRIANIATVGSGLFVAFDDGGLARVSGGRLQPLPVTPLLRNRKINALLPYDRDSKLLIGTAVDGLFLFDGHDVQPFDSRINDFLKQNQLFCGATNGTEYVFGTVRGGAVTVNFRTGEVGYINKASGLINNTVLSADFDGTGNLWLSLDHGLAYAVCNTPMHNITGSNSPIGAGYAALPYGDKLYLGTNQGLFAVDYPLVATPTLPDFRQLLQGQIWSLTQVGNTVFAASDAGLFVRQASGQFTSVPGLRGTTRVRTLKNRPDLALALTYDGFHLLRGGGGVWTDGGRVSGYDDIATDFIVDDYGDIWLAHWRKGVYRLRYNAALNRFVQSRLFDRRSGLADDQSTSVVQYNGRLVVSTSAGYYYFDAMNECMVPYPEVGRIAGFKGAGSLRVIDDSTLAFVTPHGFSVSHRDRRGRYVSDTVSFRNMGNKLIPGYTELRRLPNSRLILTGYDGFWSIDPNWRPHDRPLACYVSTVYANGDSLVFRQQTQPDPKQVLTVAYGLNTLRFNFGCNDYSSADGIEFDSWLEGYDNAPSGFRASHSRDYTKLPPGRYVLHVTARNIHTGQQATAAIRIKVLPPWYRTVWAYVLWSACLLGLLWLIYKAVKRSMARAQVAVELRKAEELAALEIKTRHDSVMHEMEIVKLRSERLEQDIAHKSQLLTDTTTNLINKNEVLQGILAHIKQLREGSDVGSKTSQRLLGKIQEIIDDSLSSGSDWENFSRNFDVVYANFSLRLTERHPELSITDKRLCCYLRMGLSSKEIAPLINITVKSVEMARYRVRKKLGLTANDSLTSYLDRL